MASDGDPQQRFFLALVRGNQEEAREIVEGLHRRGAHPIDLYEDIFYPSLVQLGELWCEGKITVAAEHRGTQIALDLMGKLRGGREFLPTVDYRIAVGSVEGNEHYVGALMVADAFRFEGWMVDFLGANVPTRDLVAMALEGEFHLLALSVCLEDNLVQLRALAGALKGAPGASAKIIAGGAALRTKKDWAKGLPIRIARDPTEAVKAAKDLLGLPRRLNLALFLKTLGERVRELRRKRGWTQQELAEKAQLDRTYVVAVELGKSNLTVGALAKLAEALEVSLEFLLLEVPGKSRPTSPF